MKALGIRGKFALWAAALAGVVVLVFAGGTFMNVYHEQLEAVDIELAVHQKQIAALSPETLASKTPEDLVGLEPWLAVAVFDAHGRMTRRSAALPEVLARSVLTETRPRTSLDKTGKGWRLIAFPAGASTVVLGYMLNEVHEIVRDLLVAYGLSLPVVVLVAAFGGWWVAGRALAPLRDLAAAAESVRADRLDRRVPELSGKDELQRLAVVLNAMLARLEIGFQQAQRFAADASHELRTPLTIMQGEIERLLRTPHLDRAHEDKLLSLQEEISRLDRITEHLLLLARFDSGNVSMAHEPVDLSALTRAACEDAELLAAAQEIEVSSEITPGIVVAGDHAHLRRVVLALLDNATRYNHPRGRVQCHLEKHERTAQLRVRNTGPGIPAARRSQVFQRFFRVDPARSRGGHGLGLSLAREIARAHGGDVVLGTDGDPEWTEFVVTLPLAR